jgi:hypothetical protein
LTVSCNLIAQPVFSDAFKTYLPLECKGQRIHCIPPNKISGNTNALTEIDVQIINPNQNDIKLDMTALNLSLDKFTLLDSNNIVWVLNIPPKDKEIVYEYKLDPYKLSAHSTNILTLKTLTLNPYLVPLNHELIASERMPPLPTKGQCAILKCQVVLNGGGLAKYILIVGQSECYCIPK